MNTKTIKQIQKIAGVKTVELAGKDMAVVVFEGEKEKEHDLIEEAIKRGFVMGAKHSGQHGADEFEITQKLHIVSGRLYGGGYGCIYDGGKWANLISEKPKPLFVTEDGVDVFEGNEYWIAGQTQDYIWEIRTCCACGLHNPENHFFSTKEAAQAYIQKQQQPKATDQAKTLWQSQCVDDFFLSFAKPKSLKPEELVDGEIYVDTEGLCKMRVIRFRSDAKQWGINLYSQFHLLIGFCINTNKYSPVFLRPATLLEKQQLITEEMKHNYFHELKNSR